MGRERDGENDREREVGEERRVSSGLTRVLEGKHELLLLHSVRYTGNVHVGKSMKPQHS